MAMKTEEEALANEPLLPNSNEPKDLETGSPTKTVALVSQGPFDDDLKNKVIVEATKQSFEQHNRGCSWLPAKLGKNRMCSVFGAGPDLIKEKTSTGVKDGLADVVEHQMEISEVEARHQTSATVGLTSEEAAIRLAKYGRNVLTPPPGVSIFVIIWHHMFANFQMLLWMGAVLCFVANSVQPDQSNFVLGVVLAVVVTLTGLFSWYQEHKSNAIMAQFKQMLPNNSVVIRDGEQREISAALLVPGDLVVIVGQQGEKVPADIRLVSTNNLKVDHSSLTGEPDMLPREEIVGHDSPAESKCLCFFGTLAVEGDCTGIIIKTGDRTWMGSIAQTASNVDKNETPIKQEIDHFVFVITVIAMIIGITFGIFGAFLGVKPIQNVVNVIGIIVANVPEGLLATVTVVLTLTAKQMALKMVLVKDLESVETLGSTTVIASDKTGTLTQNKMTLVNMCYANKCFTGPALLASTEEQKANFAMADLKELQKVVTLCNTAAWKRRENVEEGEPQEELAGSATELAMVKYFEELEPGSVRALRASHPQAATVPFDSKHKYQISINTVQTDPGKGPGFRPRLLTMKGAAERMIDRCSHIMQDGKPVPMTDESKKAIEDGLETFMSMGQRVLGCASYELPATDFPEGFIFNTSGGEESYNFPVKGLVFCGLVALADPPRPDVPAAVKCCQEAGIKVVMVTGDHPTTAAAIARQVHIINGSTREELAKERGCSLEEVSETDPAITAVVISGARLKEMDDHPEELDAVLEYPEIVFARVSPQQKLLIVQALQRKKTFSGRFAGRTVGKQVVAVTGDGVNDSPALAQADIGIAMGKVGTPVAREAANMVLLDDNFSSIVKGVEEGRKIFDNLKKSIAYTLTSNIPEITPFLLFVSLNLPLALPTILILCIDLGTDMIPAIALAYEPKEADIMTKPPRDSTKDRLVTNQLIGWSYLQIGLFQAVGGMFAFFYALETYGFPLAFVWGNGEEFLNKNAGPPTPAGKPDAFKFMTLGGEKMTMGACTFSKDVACHNPEEALAVAQTAYFVSIILCQIFTGLACKTKELSLFSHGILNNKMLLFGICTEIMMVCALVYFPPLQVLGTRRLRWQHWTPAIPFAVSILLYDEIRKLLIRCDPKRTGWVYRLTYY